MESSHNQICRTCLVEAKENQTLHFLYDPVTRYSNQSIADLLLSTIPRLYIQLEDELPKNICIQCMDTLVKLADFQRTCLRSQRKLFQMLGTGEVAQSPNTAGTITEITPQTDPLAFEIKVFEDLELLQNNDHLLKEGEDEDTIGEKKSRDVVEKDAKGRCKTEEGLDVPIKTSPLGFTHNLSGPDILDSAEVHTGLNATNQAIYKDQDTDTNPTGETEITLRKVSKYVCEHCNKALYFSTSLEEHLRVHTDERPYHCTDCGKEFKTSSHLRKHLHSHTRIKSYKCPDCPETFSGLRELYCHKKVHMKDKGHTCDDCGACFQKLAQLTLHKVDHQERKHECKYCHKSFFRAFQARRHTLIHTGEKPYKCKYCDCTFRYSYDCNTHLRTHIGENIYKCKLCPQRFRLAIELREHLAMATHKNNDVDTKQSHDRSVKEPLDHVINSDKMRMNTMEEPKEAKEGNTDTAAAAVVGENKRNTSGSIAYLSEDKINDNKQLHVPTETLPLDCAQTVNNQEILENAEELKVLNTNIRKKIRKKCTKKQTTDKEKKSKQQPPRKDLVCEYCNKVFQRRMALRIHIRVHSGEHPYLCSECGKSFAHYTSLQTHLERHSGEKRYECSECPKKFRCLSDVYSHKLTHAKIKRHICDICETGFVTFSELKKHKMYHSGVKPHKCSYCERSFTLAAQMRRHELTHTGEKPYKCPYCIMAYAQSNDRVKHLRKHLGENVYRCELCPQRFRLAREVREHFASHKNEDEATRLKNLKALQDEEIKLKATLTTPGNNVESGINDV